MRYIILTFLCLTFLIAKSQKIINNIDKVGRGEFKGNTTINRVDTMFVGQIIINQKRNDSIYFVGAVTTYDTTCKCYTNEYRFLPGSYGISFNVDVVINFDKPFTPWYETEPVPPNTIVLGRKNDVYRVTAQNGESQASILWSEHYYMVRVRGAITGDDMKISVRSKDKLYAKIESVYIGAIGRK